MVQLSKSNKKKLTSEILKNIENILQYFEIDYRKNDKCYMSHCPVHGGDNNSALNIYHSGDSENQGNWYCNTHSCHEVFGDDILGLIKGILSHNQKNWQTYGDNFISFTETIEWCSKFLNCELADSDIDKHLAIDHILTNALKLKRQKTQLKTLATIDRLRGSLEIPSNYFMGRGYKEETLKYFDVGDCTKSYKPMFERAVVPLHDSTGRKIIGCSGRSIWDQCRVCKSYHNPRQICKNQDSFWISSKWRHSKHFPSDVTLYNFHRALPVARKTGKIIITEGFPNVWRMFEAGFQSVASFGTKFSKSQKKLLDIAGIDTIIVVPDNDIASEKFIDAIVKLCKHSYNIKVVEPQYDDDIGECSIDQIKNILGTFIKDK